MNEVGHNAFVSWTRGIPDGWTVKRLKYAVRLISEKIEQGTSGLPYIGLEHVESGTGRLIEAVEGEATADGLSTRFRPDDVLFGKLRPYLAKVHRARQHGLCSGELLVLRPILLDSRYLNYFLLMNEFIGAVDGSTYGSKMPRANWEFIGNLPALVPSLDEQRAIADFLDRETVKIDNLLRQKQEFVRLIEETRRSVVARAVTRGIRGAHLKPSGVKWFGDIPQHWSTNRLGRLAEDINDVNHEMPEAVADGVPFLSAKDLKDDGSLNFTEEIKLISRSDFLRLSAKIRPRRDDIVYSRYGACLGKARLVENDREFLVSYSCVIVRLRQDVADPRFFSYLLDSDLVLTEARLRTQGIAVPDLGNKMIAKFAVPVPPLSEQREIGAWLDEKVSALRQLADTIALGIKKVRELRASLISAAVTGQIDVRNYRPQEAVELCQ